MKLIRYNSTYKDVWDRFVTASKNGTFLFHREFMEYHSDRFEDHSLLFTKNEKPLLLLPANVKDKTLYSHQGLTYGGFIMSEQVRSEHLLEAFTLLKEYLHGLDIQSIVYKPVPHIYHTFPAEEDLYALFRNQAILVSRAVSSTIDLSHRIKYSELRRRQIKKAKKANIIVSEENDLNAFWKILDANLKEKHETSPVHSLAEIQYLKSKFQNEIKLYCAKLNGEVIGGCVVFETRNVAHIQYISADTDGKNYGALDIVFDFLINEAYNHKKYFDFGISTENNGLYLNEGLISQKEGFGARATTYDIYKINI
ncbi:MAG: GNAT family N-acetyltransferase [Dysgonomonas sp.]